MKLWNDEACNILHIYDNVPPNPERFVNRPQTYIKTKKKQAATTSSRKFEKKNRLQSGFLTRIPSMREVLTRHDFSSCQPATLLQCFWQFKPWQLRITICVCKKVGNCRIFYVTKLSVCANRLNLCYAAPFATCWVKMIQPYKYTTIQDEISLTDGFVHFCWLHKAQYLKKCKMFSLMDDILQGSSQL
jgi:hypothetical protein